MIYEKDLDESIARYQGETNPSINTCIKLAACYALKHELFGTPEQGAKPEQRADFAYSYSRAAGPDETVGHLIDYDSDTEFGQVINGRDQGEVWAIMDEMMGVLREMVPRMYNAVMRKLRE